MVATVVAVACGGPPPRGPDRPLASRAPSPAAEVSAAAAPAEAAADAQAEAAERLAAIQKAMNELDEAAQGCWAAAAAIRFDVEGDLVATIEIERGGARAAVARDTTRSPQLTACVVALLGAYRWAPPLHGHAIQLPFRFRAPAGQSVIDRRLVPWSTQGAVRVAVLLDELNTGAAAASMLEVAIAPGASTGVRIADRAELWFFLTPAVVGARAVAAGDALYVPARAARAVAAPGGAEARAVLVVVPGGREGAARAGALPTPLASGPAARSPAPVHLPAAGARRYPRPAGAVTIYAEPTLVGERTLAATVIELPAGGAIPEHAHATEAELVYVLAGSGTMTLDGVRLPIAPTSAVQIPPGTRHAVTAAADLRAVQIYTPAGPEQRVKGTP
jgi:quercetin dioxygenase-like cupin family protein